MIIKSFVALGFVIKIDDMFSENFPNEIKNTASDLRLTIGKDQNTFKKIWNRLKKEQEKNKANYGGAIANVLTTFWFTMLNNFYIIIYYYMFPWLVVVLQFAVFVASASE